MLDINLIREQPDVVRKSLKDRQMDAAPVDSILELDEKRRALMTQPEALKAERNAVSKEISKLKDEAARKSKIEAIRTVGEKISAMDAELAEMDAELQTLMSNLPNIPDERTPYGVDEDENVVIRTVGKPRKFDFKPKPHWDLGPELGIIGFERGAKITFSGSKFTLKYLQNTNRGLLDVYLDGVKVAAINQYGSLSWQKSWTSASYANGVHTLRFVHAGGGTYVDVDAIEILP